MRATLFLWAAQSVDICTININSFIYPQERKLYWIFKKIQTGGIYRHIYCIYRFDEVKNMDSIRENINQKQSRHLSFKNILSGTNHFFCGSPRCIGSYFIRGLIIILPLAVTLWLIIWLFNLIDGFLSPVLEWGLGRHIPGLGFAIIVILVILIGFLGMKIGQRRFFDSIEKRIIRIPGIGAVYGGAREIVNTFNAENSAKFLEVVLVEYPRKGIYAIGLVTKETRDEDGKKFLNVFIPSAPTPASGYLQIVPESEVVHTSMSISDAMKLLISIGRVSKEDFAFVLPQSSEIKRDSDLVIAK